MQDKDLAARILTAFGGASNVATATNCMTRLRATPVDPQRVDIAALKDLDGVLGVVEADTIQIVLGPGRAAKVTDIFTDLVAQAPPAAPADTTGRTTAAEDATTGNLSTDSSWEENKRTIKTQQSDGPLKRFLRTLSSIFIPLIPAIIAAGLFSGLASVMGQVFPEQIASATGAIFIIHQLFKLFSSAFLGYFAVFTGVNAAKVFGATPALGGMLGGISIGTQIVDISTALGLYDTETPLNSTLTTGKGGIIGVIVGVWLLARVEKFFRTVIPNILDLILTPLLTLTVVGTLYVLVLMPLTGWISDGLVWTLSLLLNNTNPLVSVLSGFILAAVFLPMVLMGLHHGLIPIYALQLESAGGVSLFPVLAMAGAGQVGAALAIYFKSRRSGNNRLQKTIIGALPAGFLGVGEPLIYGVTLPLGRPFITAGLGAGFGGAYIMFQHVMSVAWGPSGLVAIPIMKTPSMMLHYAIGLVISYLAGFIITWFGIKDSSVAEA